MLNKQASLTPFATRIICNKATERPHSGLYCDLATQGTYLCRRCGLALFRATAQFSSSCGWPSFDDELAHAVTTYPDPDGQRTEICCARCDGHLGHLFLGEQLTLKNRRYCVNSAAIDFVADNHVTDTEEAIVAGGCFWGVDYYLRRIPGVLQVEVGYCGGHVDNPTYEAVCQGNTGHYESTRVLFNIEKTNYRTILKRFFEIHDPTQANGQGPDLGTQYQSAVFYYNDTQRDIAQCLMDELREGGYDVTTRLLQAEPFWTADDDHQDYYEKHGKQPYCHQPVPRFKS